MYSPHLKGLLQYGELYGIFYVKVVYKSYKTDNLCQSKENIVLQIVFKACSISDILNQMKGTECS